jgi:hypothetical protein
MFLGIPLLRFGVIRTPVSCKGTMGVAGVVGKPGDGGRGVSFNCTIPVNEPSPSSEQPQETMAMSRGIKRSVEYRMTSVVIRYFLMGWIQNKSSALPMGWNSLSSQANKLFEGDRTLSFKLVQVNIVNAP